MSARDHTAVVVLGMHRSGTSMLGGELARVGVAMGDDLFAPQSGVNEKGFFEDAGVVAIDEKLLLDIDSRWDDFLPLNPAWERSSAYEIARHAAIRRLSKQFGGVRVWGLKDPRMCRTLPLWKTVFADMNASTLFVHMLRHPAEVAGSLAKRDGFSVAKGCILWLTYVLEAEGYTRGTDRMYVVFDDVLENPKGVTAEIVKKVNAKAAAPIIAGEISGDAFADPSLRHQSAGSSVQGASAANPDPALALAQEVYAYLRALAASPEREAEEEFKSRMAMYSERLRELIEGRADVLREQLLSFNAERANYRRKFFEIYTSFSWLAAKPFWIIERALRRSAVRQVEGKGRSL